MQGAALAVDPRLLEPECDGLVHVVHDALGFLHHFQHVAVSQPPRIKRLAATLGVENGGVQHHRKLLLKRRALQHINIGNQVVMGKKQALGHRLHPHQGSKQQYK